MRYKVIFNFLIFLFLTFIELSSKAQQIHEKQDTFFLAKKKGLLGRLGKSLTKSSPDLEPQKVENHFLKFKGKFIRYIDMVSLGFESNMNDTFKIKKNLGTTIARALHKNSRSKTISNNLFLKKEINYTPTCWLIMKGISDSWFIFRTPGYWWITQKTVQIQ